MGVAKDREYIEGLFTAHRIFELRRDPVRGNFDAAHLREINRRIFQDLPDQGFADVTPGEYRKPVQAGKDWYKARSLEGRDATSFVTYSAMDKQARDEIDRTLKDADPVALGKLKTRDFTKAMGELYTKLDYLHPFPDGNSRTLRVFTSQLAEAAGYELDWTRFAGSEGGRNVLYVARDISVNQLALPHIKNDDTRRQVVFTLDQFDGNRDLPNLLRDAVRPLRAIAFERATEEAALKKHPELGTAYETLRKAVDYSTTKFPTNRDERQRFQENVRSAILQRLDAGETTDFKNKDQTATRTRQPPSPDRGR